MTKNQRYLARAVIRSSLRPSAKYSCSASRLMLANGNTAIDGRSGNAKTPPRSSCDRDRRRQRPADAVDMHRSRQVLKIVLTEGPAGKVELAGDLLVHRRGDADLLRLRQRLQARRDVDAVASRSQPRATTSPRLRPMRNSMRCGSGRSALRRSAIRWIATAQRTACTALANSASIPSPARLNTRPRCSATRWSIAS